MKLLVIKIKRLITLRNVVKGFLNEGKISSLIVINMCAD